MGILFGLTAAFCFSLTSILVRVGQRTRPDDDGVFMSVLVNVIVLGVYARLVDWPAWDTPAMIAFFIGGVIGTVGGRTSLLRAVRLIGPSRSNAFLTGAPAVAALAGWLALNETLTPIELVGGAIVVAGLLWLIKARSSETSGAEKAPLLHYVIAAGAPVSFGLAFVFRKWGLERFDSSVIGAFIGAASAYLVIVMIDAARGKLAGRVRSNFGSPSWWFVGAGFSTSAALLSQFNAFTYLEAWVVGILQATQGIWTIILSLMFLKGDERIDAPLVGSVGLVVTGVVLIALQ
ncbi:MAG: DMT family transporter [Acidimicrobiia bacterium]